MGRLSAAWVDHEHGRRRVDTTDGDRLQKNGRYLPPHDLPRPAGLFCSKAELCGVRTPEDCSRIGVAAIKEARCLKEIAKHDGGSLGFWILQRFRNHYA